MYKYINYLGITDFQYTRSRVVLIIEGEPINIIVENRDNTYYITAHKINKDELSDTFYNTFIDFCSKLGVLYPKTTNKDSLYRDIYNLEIKLRLNWIAVLISLLKKEVFKIMDDNKVVDMSEFTPTKGI